MAHQDRHRRILQGLHAVLAPPLRGLSSTGRAAGAAQTAGTEILAGERSARMPGRSPHNGAKASADSVDARREPAPRRVFAHLPGCRRTISRDPRPPGLGGTSRLEPASCLGRDQRARNLAALAGAAWRSRPALPAAIGLARFQQPPALPLPQAAQGGLVGEVPRLPLPAAWQGLEGLAARSDRLSDRRCRHAPALDHRLDAQPRRA